MEPNPETRKIDIEQGTLKHLNAARKWSMFIAITGFILLGLFIALGLIAGTFLTAFNLGANSLGISELLMFIVLIIVAVVCFLPLLFLFRFSKQTAKAVHSLDKHDLNKAIINLKLYFAFLGIIIIITLLVYFSVLTIAGSSVSLLKGYL